MPAATRTTTGAAHSIVLATSARFRLVPTFFFDGGEAETPSAGTPSADDPELFFFAMRSHCTALEEMCSQKSYSWQAT